MDTVQLIPSHTDSVTINFTKLNIKIQISTYEQMAHIDKASNYQLQ